VLRRSYGAVVIIAALLAVVVGIDLAAGMLAVGRQRVLDRGLKGVDYGTATCKPSTCRPTAPIPERPCRRCHRHSGVHPVTLSVEVSARDREVLESWLRAPSMPAGLVRRARIVLLAADGVPVTDIVERVGVSKPTVMAWKKRSVAEGLGGLADRPKPGRRPVIDEVAVVLATLEPPPERLGVTHWSSRLLAGEHRSGASGQGPRRRRALPPSAGQGRRAVRG
jgi:hypothetical protein